MSEHSEKQWLGLNIHRLSRHSPTQHRQPVARFLVELLFSRNNAFKGSSERATRATCSFHTIKLFRVCELFADHFVSFL